MIKELLIFLLLFQYSRTKNVNDSISFKKCKDDGGEFLDRWKRICIPKMFLGYLLYNPSPDWTAWKKTSVNLEVSNLQIIKIGDDTITLTMIMEMTWYENRLKINTQGFGFSFQMISLSKEEQDQVWSPHIVMKNNAVSMSKEGEQFTLMSLWGGLEAIKMFHLSTTVNCEMDFLTFPFDEHTCDIEVSNLPI